MVFSACLLAVACAPAAEPGLPNILVVEDELASERPGILGLPLDPRHVPISIERVDPALAVGGLNGGLAGALESLSSALVIAGEGQSVNEIIVRGFSDVPFFRNGLNDSLAQLGPRSLVNLERVELLKGPNAALFGPGEPGGSINFVTKRPERAPAHAVTMDFARFGRSDFSLDTTGALSALPSVQYRFVGSREQGDTFRAPVKHDRWFAAPSIAWQPSAGSDIVASLEYQRDQRLLDAGLFAVGGEILSSRRTFLGEPQAGAAQNSGLTAQLTGTFELNDTWTLEVQGQFQRTWLNGVVAEPADFEQGLLRRELQARNDEAEAWVTQFELGGELSLFGLEHAALVGFEATGIVEHVRVAASDADEFPFVIDPLASVRGLGLPPVEADRDSHERRRQYSAYVRDLVEITPRWRVLFAGRLDHIDQSGRDAVSALRYDDVTLRFTPQASVVYDSLKGVVLYASYSESIDPNEGLTPDGQPLVPTSGTSVETGLRWISAGGRCQVDTALFGIRQRNVTVDAPGRPGFELQTASQENVGVDIEVTARPVSALELSLRYHWLDTRIVDDPVLGDGLSALNVPQHQAGALMIWRTSLLRPDDIRIGLSANYVGRRQGSLEPGELGLKLDDYFRVDLFIRWQVARSLSATLAVENLTDSTYIQSSQSDAFSLNPGAPVTVRGGLRLEF